MSTVDVLMKQVKYGSKDAMKELMQKITYSLEMLADNLLFDKSLCIDIVQDTVIQIWSKREQYKENIPAWPWIARILRNRCHQEWRKNGGRRNASTATFFETEYAECLHHSFYLQDYTCEQNQMVNFAKDYIAELPDRLREVVQLSLFSELPDLDIANLLGIPSGTVKSRKSRGLSILKSKMESLNGGTGNGY